jgi:uncharacterized protein (TIGR03435 family)
LFSAPAQAFEVAAIKPNKTNNNMVMIKSDPGGRFTASGFTLKTLIAYAYRIRDFQISGGPGWIENERFDIEAKADWDSATKIPQDQLAAMLQRLLADRFQLRLHNETRDLPVFELTVAKSGSKLVSVPPPGASVPGAQPEQPPAAGAMPGPGSFSVGLGMMAGTAVELDRLIENLGPQVGRVVIDKTGLTGYFNIKLTWTPDALKERAPADGSSILVNGISYDANGPSLVTALQEQLGLRLEPARGPVNSWVIDNVERLSDPGHF